MTDTAPAIVTRYLGAADAGDIPALAECFTADGTVLDEGRTYRGHAEIVGWREALAGKWTYTSTVTGSDPISADEYLVSVHVAGDFPGGDAARAGRGRPDQWLSVLRHHSSRDSAGHPSVPRSGDAGKGLHVDPIAIVINVVVIHSAGHRLSFAGFVATSRALAHATARLGTVRPTHVRGSDTRRPGHPGASPREQPPG